MSTISAALRPIPVPTSDALRRDASAQAFMLLSVVFALAPILFGLDKFAEVMIGDWTKYLAPEFNDLIPGSAAQAMEHRRWSRDRGRRARRAEPAHRRPGRGGLAGRHHRQPAAGGRLRGHRPAGLRPAGRRARTLEAGTAHTVRKRERRRSEGRVDRRRSSGGVGWSPYASRRSYGVRQAAAQQAAEAARAAVRGARVAESICARRSSRRATISAVGSNGSAIARPEPSGSAASIRESASAISAGPRGGLALSSAASRARPA